MLGKKQERKIRSNKFLLQKDSCDCGVACFQNILRYHHIDLSLEYLRQISGTDMTGTTLLGLYQAATKLGFEAVGAEVVGIDTLKETDQPSILHTVLNDNQYHYVICYGWTGRYFLIGDPITGLVHMQEEQLYDIWKSRVILFLQPTAAISARANHQKNRWQWIIDLVKKQMNLLVLTVILGVIVSVLNLSTAIFSQKLIDNLLVKGDTGKLVKGVVLFMLLLLARSFINFIRGLIIAMQGKAFSTEITNSFYKRLLNLPKSFFDNRKTGDMISRLNDTNRIQQTVSMIVGDLSIQVLLLITSSCILFSYSWMAGTICMLFIPVLFIMVRKLQPSIKSRQKKLMQSYAANESNYIDNIKGIGIIKLFNREDYFFNSAKDLFGNFQDSILSLSKIRIRFGLLLELLSIVFAVALVSSGIVSVLHGNLLLGGLMAVLQIGTMVMQSSTSIAMANIQLQEAKVAFDRMYEFISIDTEDKQEELLKPGKENTGFVFEALAVESVCFGFPGRRKLLNNISFSVSRGEIIAITGESGTGKSTLFQLIQKFHAYQSGEILVNNEPLTTLDTDLWRKTIGVATQEPVLFSGSVIDNILLDKVNTEKRSDVINFCISNGLDDYFSRFPQGYDTPIGEGGIVVSGGQKQLICLARCLYYQPGILLLDEPTAAMDKNTETFVIQLLEKYRQEAAIILISHKDSLTNMADRVYTLSDSKLSVSDVLPEGVLL